MPGRRARRFVQKLRGMQVLHGSFVSEPFAARMSVTERFENRSRMIWRLSQNLGEMHAWGFTSAILAFFFEHTGRQAAAMQIETRHPFCDRRVIEFFLSLPLKMKTYSPLPKRVIREGMSGILPERVRERTHFAHPGSAFLSSILGDCATLLERGRFLRALEPIANYVNVESLNAGREAVLGGNMENGYALWQVVCLSVWISQQNFTQ
jgi:asparagine synthase (glutamine-hydrolysing)